MNQNASTDTSSSATFAAPADQISRRAYEIWEQEGRPEGADLRHWLQAEQELSGRSSQESAPSRNTGTDTRPLQGTRAGAAVQAKRGSSSPFGSDKPAVGNGQNAAKRKPVSAPAL